MAQSGTTLTLPRPLNRWSHDRIQPGLVGSVGDPNVWERLKQSAPDLEMRFRGGGGNRGDFISDGSPTGGFLHEQSAWRRERDFRTSYGWVYQNLVAENCCQGGLPIQQMTGDYSWQKMKADISGALHTGNRFLPLPLGYGGGDGVPRGGSVPRIVNVEPGDDPVLNNDLPRPVGGIPLGRRMRKHK